MVQLAVPRELTVGVLLLRAAAGKVGECDAFLGGLALQNEVGVAAVRQTDGEVVARAITGALSKRELAVLFRCAGGLGNVEPHAARLGQFFGAERGFGGERIIGG